MSHSFIVISDDELIGGSPKIKSGRRPHPESSTDSSPSQIDLQSSESDAGHIRKSEHARKRQKPLFPSAPEDEGLLFSTPQEQPPGRYKQGDDEFTKLRLSFPHRGAGDDRARLEFKTPKQCRRSSQLGSLPKQNSTALADETKSKVHADAQICPYYYDPKVGVTMYRGPGYERFPIVLGTIKEHQILCDRWDAQKAVQSVFSAPARFLALDSSEERALTTESYVAGAELPYSPLDEADERLHQICQIFPNIEHKFVRKLYDDQCAKIIDRHRFDEVQELPSATDLINQIADMESYPVEASLASTLLASSEAEDGTGITIKYDKDCLKNNSYFREAVIILAQEFSCVPTHYIHKTVHEKKSLFEAFSVLSQSEQEYFNHVAHKKYARLRQPRLVLEKKYQWDPPYEVRDKHQYANLVNELQAAKQTQARNNLRAARQAAKDEAEAANLALHKQQGTVIECQCCFDDEVPVNRALSCDGDKCHTFCFGCVENLANSQIGVMRHEMKCMSSSGCSASLPIKEIRQVLPLKVSNQLAFYQQEAEIKAANIDGLEHCGFCDFKAILDSIECDRVFHCKNPACGKSTCRKCRESDHSPRSCEEAKKDKRLSVRHQIEEARSEAMMRKCPKCGVKIIKDVGCNKMTCTTCKCVMCYVCKVEISRLPDSGYRHFHNPGSKCKLHDDPGAPVHDRDANAAELVAIAEAKKQNAHLDDKDLQIETGRPALPNSPPPPQLHQHFGPNNVAARARFGQLAGFNPHALHHGQPQRLEELMAFNAANQHEFDAHMQDFRLRQQQRLIQQQFLLNGEEIHDEYIPPQQNWRQLIDNEELRDLQYPQLLHAGVGQFQAARLQPNQNLPIDPFQAPFIHGLQRGLVLNAAAPIPFAAPVAYPHPGFPAPLLPPPNQEQWIQVLQPIQPLVHQAAPPAVPATARGLSPTLANPLPIDLTGGQPLNPRRPAAQNSEPRPRLPSVPNVVALAQTLGFDLEEEMHTLLGPEIFNDLMAGMGARGTGNRHDDRR